MATWSNQNKSTTTFSNSTKSSSAFNNATKFVHPWTYNESGFTYNQTTDSVTNQAVYYNLIGQVSWSNQNKL